MGELKIALAKTGRSAPGKGEIRDEMMKHLSEEALLERLLLYNKVWEDGESL